MKKSFLTFAMIAGLFLAASAQPRQQRTPEERAKMTSEMMTKQLSLTEEQKKQIYEANLERFKSMSALREKAGQGQRPDMTEMKKIQEAYEESITKTLTAEQKEKFEKARKEMGNRGDGSMGERRPGNGQGRPEGNNGDM